MRLFVGFYVDLINCCGLNFVAFGICRSATAMHLLFKFFFLCGYSYQFLCDVSLNWLWYWE